LALHKNRKGYAWFDSEKELCRYLESHYFPKKFDDWEPEIEFAPRCYIDYLAIDRKGQVVLVEVKNGFFKIKDMEQVMRYHAHATDPEKFGSKGYQFQVICEGIEEHRKEILENLGWLGTEILQIHELV